MSNVTFTPVLYAQFKRADGTYMLKVRMTFKRKSKYLSTNIIVYPEQLTRSLKIKDAGIRRKAEEIIIRMNSNISGLDFFSLERMDIDELARRALRPRAENFRLDFMKFADEVIASKAGKPQANYRSALNSFVRFIGRGHLDISEITSSLMRRYEGWLTSIHGKGARAVSLYTAAIAYMHKQARLRYNNDEIGELLIKNPFEYYKPPKQRPAGHRGMDISLLDDMLRLRDMLDGREKLGVDVYLLSFALMGMNCPDIYGCAAPKDGVLHYFRTKTRARRVDRAEMIVKIDRRIQPIMAEYMEKKGKRAFNFHRRYSEYSNLSTAVNIGLHRFAKRIGMEENLTLYSARHTWASIAYKAGIDKGVINDCLCHVDEEMRVTDLYIRKDWSILWDANEKVLDMVTWNQVQK
ncbi:MAG: site-specific integrase [Bacteroidales bacterium]|nr:site-specific integrase [Bacteroidales bacterium]